MKIGIDGACLANRRGFGRFSRQLLDALAHTSSHHEFLVFVDRPSDASSHVPAPFHRVIVDVHESPSKAAAASGRRRIGDMLAMGRAVAHSSLDLMYFPATYSFFPVWNVPRVVVTLHDTLALEYPELVFPSWRGRLAWSLKERAAVRRADCLVTVSEASRRDLLDWFKLPPDRVRLITEGPDPVFRPLPRSEQSDAILRRHGLDPTARVLLYVGGLSPHKNLPRLIEAFSRLDPNHLALAIVGDFGDVFHTHVPELRQKIAELGLAKRVVLTGFVPDDELVHLYNRAYALIQPSLLEGFGLPPVEAMACGTPVLYSRTGSLPEVVGDAGQSYDPTDGDSITGCLRGLLSRPEERDRLAARALERARRFTWQAAARMLVETFDQFDPARTQDRCA
jgi:glycosyltransferase involved in cell wall biosynthesis